MLNIVHYIKNQTKVFCTIITLVFVGFSSPIQAQVEVSGHAGLHYGDLNLSDLANQWHDQDSKLSWHLGLDGLYRLPWNDGSFAVGLRYRFAFLPETDYVSPETQTQAPSGSVAADQTVQALNQSMTEDQNEVAVGKYKFNSHRFALLGNYRFINPSEGLFVGVIAAVDVWRRLTLDVGYPLGPLPGRKFINQLWMGSFQAGLEGGYKINQNFLIRAELGYDYFPFNTWECKEGESCPTGSNRAIMQGKLDLSAPYFTLGIGWLFG